jgi:hypothetical protein
MNYRGYGILECNVLCESADLAELGVRNNDIWLPFVFDLGEVKAIKLAVDPGREESTQHNRAQVFFKGSEDYVVLDLTFDEMVFLWAAHKSGDLVTDSAFIEVARGFARDLRSHSVDILIRKQEEGAD